MKSLQPKTFYITNQIGMRIYFADEMSTWVAFYFNAYTDDQIGDAWYAFRRDDVLIHRPPTPALEVAAN